MIFNPGLAGILSSMGLTQSVDGESVGWCNPHSEVSTSSDGGRAVRPHPLHSGGTSDPTVNTDTTGQSVGLSKCWISANSDRHQYCILELYKYSFIR